MDSVMWRTNKMCKKKLKKEWKPGEEKICEDCRRDKDYCCDCVDGDLYISPDSYEKYEDR